MTFNGNWNKLFKTLWLQMVFRAQYDVSDGFLASEEKKKLKIIEKP
jgi:hypothetical protein